MSQQDQGSAEIAGSPNPNSFDSSPDSGQLETNDDANVPDGYIPKEEAKKQIDNLEKKLGEQGQELGKYRNFFQDVQPLLKKLDGQPDLVQAILDGDIDADVAQKVADGDISLDQGKAESTNNAQNDNNNGDENQTSTQSLSPEQVEKIVEDRTSQVRQEVEEKLTKAERERQFEREIQDFMEQTPDFDKYANDIANFLNEHEEIENIEVAYNAVKGMKLEEERQEQAKQGKKQAAKDRAMNATGGRSQGKKAVKDSNMLDDLIAPTSNPNSL